RVLAADDGGDDAAVEHADDGDVPARVADRRAEATPVPHLPARLLRGVDGVRARGAGGGRRRALAGGDAAGARRPPLADRGHDPRPGWRVPVLSAQGAVSRRLPGPAHLLLETLHREITLGLAPRSATR